MASRSPWTIWTRSGDPTSPADEPNAVVSAVKARLDTIPSPLLALSAFVLGSSTAAAGAAIYWRYGRRIKTGEWMTPDIITKKRWVKGVVTSVGDSDNFRLYHTPALSGYHWPFKFRRIPFVTKELKDQTLHIRIAGVDAPENAHFGRPAQPYAVESLEWLRRKILGKTVYCQVLRRDQYGRIVSYVQLSPRLLPGALVSGKVLALEMLKSGWVTTYEQSGAEYGRVNKAEYIRIEEEAKAARRGMWEHGTNAETPAEYKRRYAQSADRAETAKSSSNGDLQDDLASKSWWKRL
ncbi:hypothetical protein BDQ12DRAFT_684869 [Crucibulum laeve]|uniref:TNase-like domain-containing protein n=1 Tax=Crucibulum laeve TaxID=68775 RepID=A0A5C3LYB5_9AGAR|nr:hypothetical protein BDQ12DRAFT_684869 [Crucibulum laeve]